MPTDFYPPNPENIPAGVTEVSPAFKKEVSKVMGSIVLFFIVYLLMIVLSIGLAIACILGGIWLIVSIPKLITILIGGGIIGLGLMVFLFLIKFIFAVNRYDRSGIIEISESDQPRLFAFIRRLTVDTNTPFPKKIYLSPEVNASVFYDSSFWSMLFPVKKNLQIGLGLVNIINLSEFKAVMAHEFGHFSQRSMKLGSFVYNVNRVIYNMLYENTGYTNTLQGWAKISDWFAVFANITVEIVKGIQWVLRQMYATVNKNYMGLSRQMEFHADSVAASVSGSSSLVTALRRIELGDTGYNIALKECSELLKEKKISKNIYHNQRTVLSHLAKEFNLALQDNLPVVNDDFLKSNNLSRVNFKDQWASHPTTKEREEHLEALNVIAETSIASAWELFDNADQLQQQLSSKVYEHITLEGEPDLIENSFFEEKYYNNNIRFTLPHEYNGFYDGRQIALMNIDELVISANELVDGVTSLKELFNTENVSLPKKINALNSDIELLKAIATKNIDVRSFDFDGEKYNHDQAAELSELLEKDLGEQNQKLEQLDKKAIYFFYDSALRKSQQQAEALKQAYTIYFEDRKKSEDFAAVINIMMQTLQPVYAGETITIEQINSMIGILKQQHETQFKEFLKKWLSTGVFTHSPQIEARIEKFIEGNNVYFSGSSFFENELIDLNELANESWTYVNTYLFEKFKSILLFQLEIMKY